MLRKLFSTSLIPKSILEVGNPTNKFSARDGASFHIMSLKQTCIWTIYGNILHHSINL